MNKEKELTRMKLCKNCKTIIYEYQYRYNKVGWNSLQYCSLDCAEDYQISEGLRSHGERINKRTEEKRLYHLESMKKFIKSLCR